jgi:hypothetical protein
MEARDYWNAYVSRHGGPARVADRLSLPFPTIAAVCNGSRGIGKRLAERMAEADPELDRNSLIWVRPAKPAEATRDVFGEAGGRDG